MTAAAIDALRAEHQRALDLFDSLSPDEWQSASGCTGWRVQDVAQHMASTFHVIADPATIDGGSHHDAEANAEVPVQARRDWSVAQVLDEYREWGDKGIGALAALQEPPMAEVVAPLGNLGSHPLHILGNAIVFDHYCHLRHDIGAAIPRAAELPRDDAALDATLEWMLAGLPQMCADALAGCTQGVNLAFDGGHGTYAVRPGAAADGLWEVVAGGDPLLPTATTTAHDFVSWATKRANWRDMNVAMPLPAAAQTLDAINII
jgi:uncharacterized damage-inducible protein DinB